MSVINQMLRDLEQRKQPEQATEQPKFEAPAPSPWRGRLVLVAIVVLAAGCWWWFTSPSLSKDSRAPQQVQSEPVEQQTREAQLFSALAEAEQPNQAKASPHSKPLANVTAATVDDGADNAGAAPEQFDVAATSKPEVGSASLPAGSAEDQTPEPQVAAVETAKPAKQPNAPVAPPTVADKPSISKPKQTAPVAKSATTKAPAKATISHSAVSEQQLVQLQLNEARAFAANGRQGDAEATYRKLLKRDPKLVTARMELVALLTQQRQEGRALKAVDDGLRYLPTNAQLITLKAQLLLSLGRAEDAWNVLQVVNESQVQETGFFVIKAGLASQRNEFDVAYRNYSILAVREPSQGRWWLGKAISAEQTGQLADAVEGYRRALTSAGLSAGSMRYAQHRLDLLGTQSHGQD
ncbi:MSHA biogenesis protein MshN [Neiella marina]|uniref:MSHA biogenesis protein MshN n=1 Tax=Neiella marina TaxID=508461 RepID=A0A8J2U6Z5_9GAMM|nr:tetratricopeptide repeat protein [Neiella marina]GGA82871.1 MSHA biogenesis protein MshN [Neiella marina]